MNAVLLEKWLPLDLRWNVQVLLYRLHEFEESPHYRKVLDQRAQLTREAKIVHFVGSPKPWYHWSKIPFTDQWVWSLLRSGYYRPLEVRAFYFLRVKLAVV